MTHFRVGIIGCGRPWTSEGATGFGMGHMHARGYEASPDCEIVAAADINPPNLDAFCEEHGVARGYLDASEMLAQEELDIVSVCLWPHLHAPMVIKAAESGVKAIHCEKPMAITFGDAKRMSKVCEERGVLLTFNHMRRFGKPFRKAKELLNNGAIGQLERVEAFTSNLYDWGTHWFDMMFFYNDETPAEWVIGQIDARNGGSIFGAPLEGQGLSMFKWRNGVLGMMITGYRGFYEQGEPTKSITCANRLIGSEGTIEVGVHDGPLVRLRSASTGYVWKEIEVDGGIHGTELNVAAVLDLVDALKNGREPQLAARKALQATELIFATYESSRRRGRVDLPLEIDDSPLLTMLNTTDVVSWPEGYVEANGLRFHYYRTGGEKPALVLAHGFTDNGLCWLPVARALESDFDVIMVDARGHGRSSVPLQAYTWDDLADDLAGVIRALGLEQPAVLGHSMGASTAALAASRYPDLIGAVLLEDPAWRDAPEPELRETWLRDEQHHLMDQKTRSRDYLMDYVRQNNPRWDEAEIGAWAEAKRQLDPIITTGIASKHPNWRRTAASITCPTLLITADPKEGALVTPEIAAEAQTLNDLIHVAHIEGVGHSIRREDFDSYIEAVRTFLQGVTGD